MRIVVSNGPAAGHALEVERRLVVGRDEGCDLVLEDEKVSRRHCALAPNPDGTVTLADLGSSNGTFVRGERISAPVVLRGGEEVRVGSTLLRAEAERRQQATVVGAPATVAAAATPPREPPAPPPGVERPWWRSRWALAGGVVALLAIGGIVGGVVAASGGGDGEPVAVESTAEPEAVTETVVTEPPPETGGTETGAIDAGGLTPEQEQLLAFVPPPIQGSCDGNTFTEPTLLGGFVSGLYCAVPNGVALYYAQYDSKESMDAAYGSDYVQGGLPSDEGDCSAAFPGEGTYSIGSVPGGRVLCFQGNAPVAPVMWWTTDGPNILANATWEGRTDRELYEWWATEAGPNP